ncbi:31398_t:CDS:2 [Racocetra persica]|uniref:31398_t:CDS:1 n=1 Tax=Racocetra persica TaxID=160502 RepID=A0ACA9KGN7_9GLOM|nr:31398_t:CDS:2 [Racocetra persica]
MSKNQTTVPRLQRIRRKILYFLKHEICKFHCQESVTNFIEVINLGYWLLGCLGETTLASPVKNDSWINL